MANIHIPSDEVAKLLDNVVTAGEGFKSATEKDAQDARRKLEQETTKLLYSLQDPYRGVWTRDFQINVSISINILSDLKLWERFAGKSELSFADIVECTGAGKGIIVHLLHQIVASGVLAEIPGAVPKYYLTVLGEPYLNPDCRKHNQFILKGVIPTVLALPELLKEHGYQDPGKEIGYPFKWKHNEEDIWQYFADHPELMELSVATMRSHNTGRVSGTAYPWAEAFVGLDLKDTDAAIVDVAGGQGHVLEELRKLHPEIKGRFINQDRPDTFKGRTPPIGCEYMEYDMFEPQPVRNARIYHYKHIFHDWADELCTDILNQMIPLLKVQPESKLLIVDIVLPNSNVTMEEAIRDFTMLVHGGLERTEKQWSELLGKSGLKIKKIWRGIEAEACLECELLSEQGNTAA